MSRLPISYTPEQLIKTTACEVGFSAAGIAAVKPSAQSNAVFAGWIAAGRHGEMRYLDGGRDKRNDPGLLLDGARSVICVAVNYYTDAGRRRNETRRDRGDGVFSLYAHDRDYHRVLGEMLLDLEDRLRAFFPEMRTRACVDTQPISERDFAIRSGIAWLGKNTMVISPEYGSWIFLGELITDLELEPDVPLETQCGSCTRCLDACPTGALLEPFELDATRCISYLTIEKRGDIPASLEDRVAPWLFGCDDCQSVCPFNARAQESAVFDAGVTPIVERTARELADIDEGAFRRLTEDSPVRRAKMAGIRRNARLVRDHPHSAE